MGHKQDSEPGLSKLTHGVAKLQLRANVQRIAGLIEEQRLRLVRQGPCDQRALGFAGRHFRDRASGKMRDAKPRHRFVGQGETLRIRMMMRKYTRATEKTGEHHVAAGGVRGAGSQQAASAARKCPIARAQVWKSWTHRA